MLLSYYGDRGTHDKSWHQRVFDLADQALEMSKVQDCYLMVPSPYYDDPPYEPFIGPQPAIHEAWGMYHFQNGKLMTFTV